MGEFADLELHLMAKRLAAAELRLAESERRLAESTTFDDLASRLAGVGADVLAAMRARADAAEQRIADALDIIDGALRETDNTARGVIRGLRELRAALTATDRTDPRKQPDKEAP